VIEILNPLTKKVSKLQVSSNNSALLDYKLANFEFSFQKMENGTTSKTTTSNLVENSNTNLEIPEKLDEVSFEFIDEKGIPEGYSFNIKKKATKVLPPSLYFVGFKTDDEYLYLDYIPVESDESGLLFKWGYKTKWYKSWTWDEKWRWHQGFNWNAETASNPANGYGYYKIGVELYTNTYSNFRIWHQ